MRKALIPLADGFEEIEAITVIDVLRRGEVEVVTASLTNSLQVHAAHAMTVMADALLSDVINDEWDAIILPGGSRGMENLRACETLLERLRRQKEQGGLICAICAAPLVLEAAGIIENEHVTCYPTCAEMMEHDVQHVPTIADGQLITSAGPGTAMLFAFVILQHLAAAEQAADDATQVTADPHAVAHSMLVQF